MDWNEYFIRLAHQVAQKSSDPSTKVGAVLVRPDKTIASTGYNGLCRGIEHRDERYERPLKYLLSEHGERNALHFAKEDTSGYTLYLNWEPTPCVECTKAVIQNDLARIVGPSRPFGNNKDWKFETSQMMLDEAGVDRRVVDVDIGGRDDG